MLNDADLICFAATKNADAARAFSEHVLGLPLIEDGPFAIVFNANGTMLRLQKIREHSAPKHTALGWRVTDIRAYMNRLVRKGVRFEHYERLTQDEAGVWETPSGALIAWFLDPDGNVLH